MQSNEFVFTPSNPVLLCSKCGARRTEGGKIHKDGTCQPCRKLRTQAYQLAYRPKKNAQRREAYRKNSLPKRAENKLWRENNREKIRISKRRWKKKNPTAAYRWDRMNPHKIQVIKDRSHLKIKYGMTVDGWDALYKSQGGKCAICEVDFSSFARRPHTDHDHSTGKVRNLLCSWCNHVVGVIEDTELFERALQYVQRWKEVPLASSEHTA